MLVAAPMNLANRPRHLTERALTFERGAQGAALLARDDPVVELAHQRRAKAGLLRTPAAASFLATAASNICSGFALARRG